MKNFVVWSGGCDSTLLLVEMAADATLANPLYAVSFTTDHIGEGKSAKELEARKKIKSKLSGKPIEYIEIKTQVEGIPYVGGRQGLSQPPLWLGSLLPFMFDDSRLCFGYIVTDHFWHYRSHFESMFDSLAKIAGRERLSFYFPYEWNTKVEILKRLKEEGFYDLCWWCENPDYADKVTKICNVNCSSCPTHILALNELALLKSPRLIGEPQAESKMMVADGELRKSEHEIGVGYDKKDGSPGERKSDESVIGEGYPSAERLEKATDDERGETREVQGASAVRLQGTIGKRTAPKSAGRKKPHAQGRAIGRRRIGTKGSRARL